MAVSACFVALFLVVGGFCLWVHCFNGGFCLAYSIAPLRCWRILPLVHFVINGGFCLLVALSLVVGGFCPGFIVSY
jgi:hypothetical protein